MIAPAQQVDLNFGGFGARAAVSAGWFRRRDSQGGLGGPTDVLRAMEFSLRELGDVSNTYRSRSLQVAELREANVAIREGEFLPSWVRPDRASRR
jgi:hypothetical protein